MFVFSCVVNVSFISYFDYILGLLCVGPALMNSAFCTYKLFFTDTECLCLRLGVAISRMLCLRAACYWLTAWQQAGAVHHSTRTVAIVNVCRFVIYL